MKLPVCDWQIHAVRILGEMEQVLLRAEKTAFKFFVFRRFLSTSVSTANVCLNTLGPILFGLGGDSEGGSRIIIVNTVGILGDSVVLLVLRAFYLRAKIFVVTNCQEWSPHGTVGVFGASTSLGAETVNAT